VDDGTRNPAATTFASQENADRASFDATQCFSVGNLLLSCFDIANQAATFLDLERTGQSTFAALANELENKGGTSAEAMEGLSLAESAPASMSSDQLGRNVYKQCSSYVVIH
jgi:hypothetical protein